MGKQKVEFVKINGPLPFWIIRKGHKNVGRIRGYNGKGAVIELWFMHANPGSKTNPHLRGCCSVNDAKRVARILLEGQEEMRG